ncbi:hypothetical protein [Pseudescherichia sp.]|uniref:hypothetical protein n=1 Tax=Pseudescherichia sp. TaxID=2055881 RepID=UPI00289D04F8|nr:hypothetical protein [Pseudescherichia sp.]
MSWDNVKGVSAAQIWTDNPDITQAYLFANGNHQVKLTVGLSLSLANATQPGPTEDEVKAALSLIDFDTGAGLSHLKTDDKGSYSYVYLPTMAREVNPPPVSDANNTGAYQYEVDYYISSDSTINADYASEKVALLLSYTDVNNKEIEYYTASGSKSQSYVAVTVYSPKRYGMVGSTMTPVIFEILNDQLKIDQTQVSGWVNHLYEPSAILYGIRIDDSYFRFSQFKVSNTALAPNAFIQHIITNFSDNNDYSYVFAHNFLPQENKLYFGGDYDATMNIMSSDSWVLVGYKSKFTQQPGQILIGRIYNELIYAMGGPGPIASSNNSARITAYDQFGNAVYIAVDGQGDGYPALTSVS